MRPLQLSLAIAAGILFSTLFSFAWTGPTSAPPNGNADPPINIGNVTQFKNGNIGLYGNILLAASGGSYLNFGATSGSTGYGIRDNNGTLEFKSTGGIWTNLTTTVTNVLGIGAVSQIKFSDGTTQTTAATSSSNVLNWSNPKQYNASGYSDRIVNTGVHKLCILSVSGDSGCGRCGVSHNANGSWSVDDASCTGNSYNWCQATCFDQ